MKRIKNADAIFDQSIVFPPSKNKDKSADNLSIICRRMRARNNLIGYYFEFDGEGITCRRASPTFEGCCYQMVQFCLDNCEDIEISIDGKFLKIENKLSNY